jgi:hypothetical protein
MRGLSHSDIKTAPGLEGRRPDIPAILFFTMPDCVPCHIVQRPAIEQVQKEMAERVQILEVDASVNPTAAIH